MSAFLSQNCGFHCKKKNFGKTLNFFLFLLLQKRGGEGVSNFMARKFKREAARAISESRFCQRWLFLGELLPTSPRERDFCRQAALPSPSAASPGWAKLGQQEEGTNRDVASSIARITSSRQQLASRQVEAKIGPAIDIPRAFHGIIGGSIDWCRFTGG